MKKVVPSIVDVLTTSPLLAAAIAVGMTIAAVVLIVTTMPVDEAALNRPPHVRASWMVRSAIV